MTRAAAQANRISRSARGDPGCPWGRPEVLRHAIRDAGDGLRETLLLIDGVRCAGCVATIERTLGAVPGIVDIEVNAASRRGRIRWRDAELTLPRLLALLEDLGYRALPLDAEALDDVRKRESHAALKRLGVAGFGAMQAMMYAAVLYFGDGSSADLTARELFRWLGFIVATPVVLYSARPFFLGAVHSLKSGRPGMDVPVAIAVGGIYLASVVEAMRGGTHVYFESVSMFVFFLLIGRYVEMRARHRASDLTDALARLTPPFADRRLEDGGLERIGVRELTAGDRVRVAEGDVIPADGALLNERCLVDEALLSGESAPVPRVRGERLVAGSLLIGGPAEMQVERVGSDTMLAGIAELVGRAQAARPRLAQAGDRAASRFVVRILGLTVLTAAVWSVVDPARAFTASLAVLVVSCPCAFALAVPVAITRAMAVLARRGVLVVKPDAVEALARATHVVFDKTGTLTASELALSRIEVHRDMPAAAALELAAALARESRHPVAQAITRAGTMMGQDKRLERAEQVQSFAGRGIRATVGGVPLALGRADFGIDEVLPRRQDEGAVVLADAAGAIASFHLTERLRADARDAVGELVQQGLSVSIASGDIASKVSAVAERIEVREWRARQSPADKLAYLTGLREQGARVVAVGDGVNDAPVLGGADVAIALAEGAELAQATSDLVLTGGSLAGLAVAHRIARQALEVLRQNQRWAFGYNVIAVPLAALGFVPPWLAALGMSFSSLVVVLNAMRIGSVARSRHALAASATDAVDAVASPRATAA